jgi:anti-sigma factor ChrR (cupin superfamily)
MKLHADHSLPAVVESHLLPWTESPIAGIERRMLERDGGEVARATSLVRYAPGSSFSAHTHGAGEEFLVLAGVFSDETGDFPAGYYVRNAPGSRHTPSSAPGAIIFVKLRQMPACETAMLRIDTRERSHWHARGSHLQETLLFDAPWERVVMRRLEPGYDGPMEELPRGGEFFVVEGILRVDGRPQPAGTWLRLPAGSRIVLASAGGALLYCKTGHLG